MGRQSSRMYFCGKDHKDIYYQGHYHDKMYIGSQLVWEKLNAALWEVFRINNIFNVAVHDTAFYDGLFMALVEHVEEGRCYLYTSENGVDFETLLLEARISSPNVYRLYCKNNTVYLLGSNGNGYAISEGVVSTLTTTKYFMFGYEVGFTIDADCEDRLFINNKNKVYHLKSCLYGSAESEDESVVLSIHAGYYLFESEDMINWHCINCSIYNTTQTDYIMHQVYCPVGLKAGTLAETDYSYFMYGQICKVTATTEGTYNLSYEDMFLQTSDFMSYVPISELEQATAGHILWEHNNVFTIHHFVVNVGSTILYTKDFEKFYENVPDMLDYSLIEQAKVFGEKTGIVPFAGAEGENGYVFFFGDDDARIVETDKDFKVTKTELFVNDYTNNGNFDSGKKLLFGNGLYVYIYHTSDFYISKDNGVRTLVKREE